MDYIRIRKDGQLREDPATQNLKDKLYRFLKDILLKDSLTSQPKNAKQIEHNIYI